jgi:hypothetical protein
MKIIIDDFILIILFIKSIFLFMEINHFQCRSKTGTRLILALVHALKIILLYKRRDLFGWGGRGQLRLILMTLTNSQKCLRYPY